MKISFITHLTWATEGRTKIVKELQKGLEKKGHNIVFDTFDADVVHIHSSGLMSANLINKINVPSVYTLYSPCDDNLFNVPINFLRDMKLNKPKKWFKHFLLYVGSTLIPIKLKGINLRKFDVVTTPSKYVKNKLFNNTQQINFGIDTDKFKPRNIKKDHIVAGYVGHFSHFKGVFDFMEATKNLHPPYCEVRYYLSIDDHKMLNKAKNIIKSSNKDAKVFGYTKDIEKVYNEIDILVYPLQPGLSAIANPLVLLEAMASGCVVITTDIFTVEEIAKGSCVLVKPDNPAAIEGWIKWFLEYPQDRLTFRKQARKVIEKHYNVKDMINNYEQLYEDLIK